MREKAKVEAVTAKQQGRMMMMLLLLPLLLLQRKMFWRCTFCHISGYISNSRQLLQGEERGSGCLCLALRIVYERLERERVQAKYYTYAHVNRYTRTHIPKYICLCTRICCVIYIFAVE